MTFSFGHFHILNVKGMDYIKFIRYLAVYISAFYCFIQITSRIFIVKELNSRVINFTSLMVFVLNKTSNECH